MSKALHTMLLSALIFVIGCDSAQVADDLLIDSSPADGPCDAAVRVGGFEAALNEQFTSVQGTVADGVTPFLVPNIVAEEGQCRLLSPPSLFCDPSCGAGTTCDADGLCIDTPSSLSVGVVTLEGLLAPVEMEANPPVFFYTNTAPLDHPGWTEGQRIDLLAAGDVGVGAFAMAAWGITELITPQEPVGLDANQPVNLTWTAAGEPNLATININLNIAQHGGTPGWIECEVADSGSFEIPLILSDQLLNSGFSGWPSVALTRRSVDSFTSDVGCIELSVQSRAVRRIDIPGLISCSGDEDCPDGQHCQVDLTCG